MGKTVIIRILSALPKFKWANPYPTQIPWIWVWAWATGTQRQRDTEVSLTASLILIHLTIGVLDSVKAASRTAPNQYCLHTLPFNYSKS